MCHSRTKCKFSIFLSILLSVFEAQVTVDRSRAVILQFCYNNGLVDRGGEKSVIPALQLTHSGTGVKETQTLKCCGKIHGKTWVKLRFCAIFKQKHWKKRRIFILSWFWAQKNVCHSRTKCKFNIFLSILLGVFEAQVTVDRYLQWILIKHGAITVPGRICTWDRPECDFPTCAFACVCSCSLENPQSKACGKKLSECSR